MKNIIIVSTFFAGIILGMYFLNPLIVDTRSETISESDYYGYCHDYEDGNHWFEDEQISQENQDLLRVRFEELLIENNLTEDELYANYDIMHEIMEELWDYAEELGIEYYDYGYHHMGRMYR